MGASGPIGSQTQTRLDPRMGWVWVKLSSLLPHHIKFVLPYIKLLMVLEHIDPNKFIDCLSKQITIQPMTII